MSPVRKQPYKRVSFQITPENALRVGYARKAKKMSKSAVVRQALTKAFRTFEPLATVGAITLDGQLTLTTSFNLPEGTIKRLDLSAKGWRYSRTALFNALLDHSWTGGKP